MVFIKGVQAVKNCGTPFIFICIGFLEYTMETERYVMKEDL